MTEIDTLSRAIGMLEGTQVSMQDQIEDLAEDIKELKASVNHLVSIVDSAKGSWRALVAVGSIAGMIGSAIAWIVSHLHR